MSSHASPGWWLNYWEITKCVGAVFSYLSCLAKRAKKGRNHFITDWIHCPVQRVSWRELTWVLCSVMSFRTPSIDNGLQELDCLLTVEAMTLTPSVRDVTWKRPLKVRNLKPLNLCVIFFTLACERIFIKTHRIESRCVIGPEHLLFAGASLHLSARKFYRLGQWWG